MAECGLPILHLRPYAWSTRVEDVVPLDGQFLNAIGLFLCGEPAMTIGNPDLPFELNSVQHAET